MGDNKKAVMSHSCLRSFQELVPLTQPHKRGKFQVSSHKVNGKLITKGIDNNIKQEYTLSLVFNVHHKRHIR